MYMQSLRQLISELLITTGRTQPEFIIESSEPNRYRYCTSLFKEVRECISGILLGQISDILLGQISVIMLSQISDVLLGQQ